MIQPNIEIRPIQYNDNPSIKNIIKNTLIEFNSALPGTAFFDKSLDAMFETYQSSNSQYYVALLNNEIVGGCGIAPLEGENDNTCELQKMYILPKARGMKIGKSLLEKCLNFAKKNGFDSCYLESFPYMTSAVGLYKKHGFKKIERVMGNTGHTACDVRMLLKLKS